MDLNAATDPFELFGSWLAAAEAAEPSDANAMALATATPDGMPAVRVVLLKGHDRGGFVFYTNLESAKGRDLAANPRAELCFHWKSLKRQVRIAGAVGPVGEAEADAYFASRPRASRIGAWASRQSRPLDRRETFDARIAELDARFPGEAVPRPEFWSGFRLVPERFEFWQDRAFRLHDRILFTAAGSGWARGRLYP